MTHAKLINGQLEYFKQPAWLLGDAAAYATEQGYKEVTYSEYPVLEANQYVREVYTETETQIVVSYEVLTDDTSKPLTVEKQLAELQQVIVELTTILNDKGIAP